MTDLRLSGSGYMNDYVPLECKWMSLETGNEKRELQNMDKNYTRRGSHKVRV